MTDSIWRLHVGETALIATAIHDGHEVREDVARHLALNDTGRLREEDPYTGHWTLVAPTRVIGTRSRFEVDLNRPRDKAVYRTPEDAWGLTVWKDDPPEDCFSESLAEYSALMVMEKEYGPDKMRHMLKYELDGYLKGRGRELVEEMPLMLVEDQKYIHYNKGCMVMYALKDYIGEESVNRALARYLADVAFQQPPYTNSIEFLEYLREVTPDSLAYIIEDMFETITLFSNKVMSATSSSLGQSTLSASRGQPVEFFIR